MTHLFIDEYRPSDNRNKNRVREEQEKVETGFCSITPPMEGLILSLGVCCLNIMSIFTLHEQTTNGLCFPYCFFVLTDDRIGRTDTQYRIEFVFGLLIYHLLSVYALRIG